MGAYYKAVINNEYSIHPHNYDNGLKLMEHSYLENHYCKTVEQILLNKSALLVWLCDYHEPDEIYKHEYADFEDKKVRVKDSYNEDQLTRYFINHTKECYIDAFKLMELSKEKSSDWCIHPLPILCNSDTRAMGGGDYYPEDSRRATWCNDEIEVVLDKSLIPEDYEDVTADCLFFE